MKNLLIILALALGVASCGDEPFFEKNISLDDSKWPQDKEVEVKVDVNDLEQAYNVFVNMRNTKDYGYSNLHVFLTIVDPDGEEWSDTLEYRVAEDNGKWTGEVSSSYVMNSWLTYENFRFPKKGEFTFKLRHGMYDEALPEVMDVGIKLEE